MKNNKNMKAILLGVILMVLAVAGATYAYFTATISDGDKGSSVIIRTGTLRLVYSDTEYINVSGVLPGESYSKTVTVTNEGNVPVSYHLVWIELLNELTTKNDLTMEISCSSNTDTCGGLNNTVVSDSGETIPILYNVEIGMLETHTYTITLHFNETGSNQNDNQGKIISGKIGIIEARDLAVNLYGYVYDENSSVLPNVVVELHSDPVSVVTDSTGRYELDNIPLGSHTVYIKTSDGSSTMSTTTMFLKYGKNKSIVGNNATIVKSENSSIGINIYKSGSSSSLTLFVPAGTLKGTTGIYGYSGQYYAYKALITNVTFDNKINIPSDAVSSWDVSTDGSSKVMAYIKSDGVSGYNLHIQGKDGVKSPENSSYLFGCFSKMTTINNIDLLNTSAVVDMQQLFQGCSSLTSLDLSSFITNKVQNMSVMFDHCSSLISLDLSMFDVSKVINMQQMFNGCSGLTTIDLSNWNTSNVTNMSYFMQNCSSLSSLDLSIFDTTKVTTMTNFLSGSSNLITVNLSSFNNIGLINISSAFYGLTNLATLYMNNASFSNITSYSAMLQNVKSGVSIYVKDSDAQTFINARLTDAGIIGNIAIG